MDKEMIFYFQSYWNIFSAFYCTTYALIAIGCIIFYVFKKDKWKGEILNWLYTFNTIVLWIALINFIIYATELFIAWYGQNPYEWYAFKENKIWSPYGWSYWMTMFLNFILPQLFWFKRLRRNPLFTFVVAFFLSLGIWFERLVIYITSAYRDYLPSSWSTTYNDEQSGIYLQMVLKLVCFVIVSLLVYSHLHKRKKLPFPSVILPYSLFFIPYSLFHCTQHFN